MISEAGRKRRLIFMFTLTFIYMVFEVVIGVKFKCMSLMADAFHMISDVIALTVGYISISLTPKAWKRSTFGWARAEVLGALINGVFLLALCFSLLIRAIEGFIEPALMEQPLWVLIVGSGGLLMNLLGLAIFHESDESGHGHSHGKGGDKKKGKAQRAEAPNRPRRDSLLKHRGRLTRMVAPPVSVDVYPNPSFMYLSKAEFPSQQSSSHSPPRGDGSAAHTSIAVHPENPSTITALEPDEVEKGDEGSKKNVSMKGVYLHLIADTLGSVVVVIVAAVVYFTEKKRLAAQVKKGEDLMPWKLLQYLDPTLTVLIVILICCSTVPLVQEASLVLLQTIPSNINLDKLKKNLLKSVDGVLGIHEFHVWQLAGDRIIGSIHIRFRDISQYQCCVRAVKDFFHRNGIHSITVQAEFQSPSQLIFGPERQHEAETCLLLCPPGTAGSPKTCASNTCCGQLEDAHQP